MNENEFTHDGVELVAVPARTCARCVFDVPESHGCKVVMSAPSCNPLYRKDGRGIVWMKKQ
jgi:hypothetical protein